ncbi:glycosyltransferase family 2 protein [Thalassobellus citreus]|uniref:glycosyltransferase family 2 protein n=1 Tax=Thalassobellus citreus TaxID=3367752 RepID=UPI0037A8EACE
MITYNEVNHIDEVIENISFTDEIIVIDSFSTDGTIEKLKSHKNVKTICREFKNFTDQRNFALQQASNDWVLFIDADERLTPSLKKEITTEITKPHNDIVGFMFRREFYFNQKRIRFSGFQTDTTYRLFQKQFIKYNEAKIVHEMPLIKGKSKILKSKMLHYFIDNAAHYKSKMEHYATLKALEIHKKGVKPNFFHFYFKPFYKFIYNYFIRLGVFDGKEGFTLCYLSAYGVYYRYVELKKLNS